MWTAPLQFCLRFWRELLIISLLAALTLSISLGRHWANQRDEARELIRVMEQIAKTYQDESKETASETSAAFTTLVSQIKTKDLAIANAKARFGDCAPVDLRPVGVLYTPSSDGQARIPEIPSGPQISERLACDRAFIDAAAADAAFVRSVQEWRMKNNLPVKD